MGIIINEVLQAIGESESGVSALDYGGEFHQIEVPVARQALLQAAKKRAVFLETNIKRFGEEEILYIRRRQEG